MRPERRQNLLLVLTLAFIAVLGGQLVYVQGIAGPAVAAEALESRLHTVAIPGDRGDIVDAEGEVLATSVERYDIVVNQMLLAQWKSTGDSVEQAATVLAPILGVSVAELAPVLDGQRGYAYVARGVTPEVYREIATQRIPGITAERTTERMYPAGTTAGNIVGFVGRDGNGLAGLEQVLDAELSGTPGRMTYEQGRRGQRIPAGGLDEVPAVPGRTVHLTIARDVQYMAQTLIDTGVLSTGAQWGAIQVLDVESGEILALADSGTVDPNTPGDTPADLRGSRSSSVIYEPGSTAKAITMAAVLEQGITTPTAQYQVPDVYTTENGQSFKDSHPHALLNLTATGIFAESSNTGTVMLGEQLPRQVRHDYLAKFGLGQVTGVGLPGEEPGLLHDADSWDGRSQYAVLFGQAVSVTTLQATQVFATLANGGVRVQPHLVKGWSDADGVFHAAQVPEPTRVVSEETADTVVRMMESAVAEGTGSNASVPGYRIGGKTGTAQAFEGGGVIKNVASFIGVAPVDDPKIVVNVVLYDPKTSIYGGAVAAPLFAEVTQYALQYLGVPPSGTPVDLLPSTWE
ncbi:penicillin-binding protein 2 [Actinotalea sp. K2]|uniref:peptidoglycan D,D-transpeptidase FtsI family protein n=1 Tax=Actinotalea sp. K2 TaxID=2939438 RepID=UPI0020183769|nr:penicillin-binding protein 2 [Actinotalea sp. K2]MCL3860127.1 penicillin-binding protein 2 [Actinotalea sp. K2]